MSPKRSHRVDSPFTTPEISWIVTEFSKLGSATLVRRRFRNVFMIPWYRVSRPVAFTRVWKRFREQGSLKPKTPPGLTATKVNQENIDRVKNLVDSKHGKALSLPMICSELGLSKPTVWRILRKKLHYYPYKTKRVQPLTQAHKEGRIKFANWVLEKDMDFWDKVLFSDEKLWVEKVRPNTQNERYWADSDPEVETDCREQGGRKIMCWAGLIDGKVILHWFNLNENLNQDVYLDMLNRVVWPQIRSVSTRKGYYFQQDGATCHTTQRVRNWLEQKFDKRIISRFTDIPWPSKSPDFSPLDYWFWSVCLQELRRHPPSTLEELVDTINEFAESLEDEEIRKAVKDIKPRAAACKNVSGGAFEYKLKKMKKKLNF